MRKNPIARTIKKRAKGYRTHLGETPGAGIKSMEARGKTNASGHATYRVSAPQTRPKIF